MTLANLKRESLWPAISAETSAKFESLGSNQKVDVAIIGGGITGLSTALHLAEQGCRVTVLEANSIPSGGSGRSVGLVNAGLWTAPDDIVEKHGEADGERANRVLGDAPGRVFDLIDRFDIAADAQRTGTLHLTHNVQGAEELKRRSEQFRNRGAPVELLDAGAVRERAGLARIHAALLDRRAGTVNPAAYTRGLARAAAQQGANIYTDTRACAVARNGGHWNVTTERATETAEHVVLATNGYTEGDWNAVKPHFFPGAFFQVASKPLEGEIAQRMLGEGQGAWDTRTVLSSIRRDVHGRLILGSLGNANGRPDAYLRAWANRIQRHYMPELGHVDWEYVWTGVIAFTPDHMLRLFQPAPNLLAVTGYNGRGITTGTTVGKGFADIIMHGDDSALPLPLRNADPVSMRYMRSRAYESGFTLYHAAQVLRVLI
jgi:glycine/D-amino acid oxidase-like deaminating enzyme